MKRWQYYLVHFLLMVFFFLVARFFEIHFSNTVFFLLAYAWHFTLETPGAKEAWVKSKKRFSFITMVFRFNHYLLIYAASFENKLPKFAKKIKAGVVRGCSPFLFALTLIFFGGAGNILYVLLGSILFEMCQALFRKSLGGF